MKKSRKKVGADMSTVKEYFPDGTEINSWFYDLTVPNLNELGKQYVLTDYGILDDGKIYTKEIQNLIDTAYQNGGGVIVVPKGTYLTGAIYFKQGVHLYVDKDAVLKGSDDINDYDVKLTRIEGELCDYFTALINVDNVNGFYMLGKGTIDGNGLKAWKAFWLRRTWNPNCTNKDEQRPRLTFISNSKNVLVSGLTLKNSHFWTNHIYKSNHIKFLNCKIYSPIEPVCAPSTDAIDIDVCTDVLVKNCEIAVNDDSVVLKGGKGPWADTAKENGSNERILVEDCEYGFCHGCLTCGSESVHNRNILVRRIKVSSGLNLLWLKMRPDTPQVYEYIKIEDVSGKIDNLVNINPWTQFFDLKGRTDKPISQAKNIFMSNCECECETFFNVKGAPEQYKLSNFNFDNITVTAENNSFDSSLVENFKIENVVVNKKSV